MKVQVIFNSSYPIGNVSTHRVHHMCKGLQDNGVDVELLIAHPTEKKDEKRNVDFSGEFEHVKFRYISKNIVRKKNIFFRKTIDFFCHLAVIFEVLFNRKNNDIFLVIGPSLDFRTFLPMASLFNKSKIFLEINEYPFLNNADNLVQRIKRFFWLHFIVPLYDGFIVISTELDDLICKYKSRNSKTIKVPILGSFSMQKREFIPIIQDLYMIHAGSLVESKDGIMGILKAYKLVLEKLDEPLKFVVTGNTKPNSYNQHIHEYIGENNLQENIIFTGFLDNNEMENYLKGSAFAIINKFDNLQNRYCFSTKLSEYIKYGVPVIATSVGESQVYLRDGFNAYLVEPNDQEALVEKMIDMVFNKDDAKKMANNGYQLIEKDFNYLYQGKLLSLFLMSVLENQSKE